MMTEEFVLEKRTFSETDFQDISWHDCRIYAMALSVQRNEFILDIDYICKWIMPDNEHSNYSWLIAPATMIFKDAYDVTIDIDAFQTEIIIDGIKRSDHQKNQNIEYVKHDFEWLWTLDCMEGEISVVSTGYSLYLRTPPTFQDKLLPAPNREYSFYHPE